MKTYISFLRGINMAGHNPVKMTDLSVLYRNMGFNDAVTYIQTGNVLFSNPAESTVPEISQKIEKAILEKLGYKIPVLIRTTKEIQELISANPFLEEVNFEPSKMAVIFLHEKPSEAQIQKVLNINYPPDKFKIVGSEIFTYCPHGFGKTRLYTNFFEKKMGVTGTARNWQTIMSILQLAEK
jgi:uncharacterized protein (DUF1697 family)